MYKAMGTIASKVEKDKKENKLVLILFVLSF